MKILLIIVGIILLLPGICSAWFMTLFMPDAFSADMMPILALWFFSFAISAFGIILIRHAMKRP